jgi:flagellar hook assembly protein FlgD
VSLALEGTGVPDLSAASLALIRPNPFTSETTVAYTVPSAGAAVAVRVYDVRGRLVRTLAEGPRGGGAHSAVWDGRDSSGRIVSPGIYFCRAEIGGWTEVRKVVLLR